MTVGRETRFSPLTPSMKLVRRCQRILILSMLSVTVLAPIVLFSLRLKTIISNGRPEFIEDVSKLRYGKDSYTLNAVEQEVGEGLRAPKLVYEDKDVKTVVSHGVSMEDHYSVGLMNAEATTGLVNKIGVNHSKERQRQQYQDRDISSMSREKEQYNKKDEEHNKNIHPQSQESKQTTPKPDPKMRTQPQRSSDSKVKEIKDQLVRARAYLNFAPPGSNSHLVKELKLRIRELERAAGDPKKDSDLSRSALQKMRRMDTSLIKASHVFPDCTAMVTKLRAMTQNAEEQVRSHKNQATYYLKMTARTTSKGLHCLSMRLTTEYFALQPEDRQMSNQQQLHDLDLYHYVIFSDNVLACAVVVNSTATSAMEPEKIVFHVVTDSLNFPAITMWFLLNPPDKASINIQSIDSFDWFHTEFDARWKKQIFGDPRFTSDLNHLRFYLPSVFPDLNKIILLDHDVVVQKDISALWSVDMKGKVNGAVGTCQEGDVSFRRMDMFLNFSEQIIAKKFDIGACTWAFGLNLFDLSEWRKNNLTAIYREFLQLAFERPILKVGSLPLGWITFYNKTVVLDRHWHVLGLGYDSDVQQDYIEQAAVVHFDGIRKPWLDTVIGRHKDFWNKYVNYDDPYLQQCNIHL